MFSKLHSFLNFLLFIISKPKKVHLKEGTRILWHFARNTQEASKRRTLLQNYKHYFLSSELWPWNL